MAVQLQNRSQFSFLERCSLVVKILKSAQGQTAGNRGKTAMALISFVPLTDKPESLRAPEKEAPAQKTVLRYVKLLARQE